MTGPHLPIVISPNQYMVTVINKFDTLQKPSERHTPNDKYENCVTAHLEAAVECLSSKLSAKCRQFSWESIAVREKQDNVKKTLIKETQQIAIQSSLRKSRENYQKYQKKNNLSTSEIKEKQEFCWRLTIIISPVERKWSE